MGNLFKVISNKMSKPGFHPDLLPQVQSCSRSPKAASALPCSLFESKDATLAHPTAEIMFFFIIPIRNSPLGPLETVICMKGWRSGEGIVPAPESRIFCPLELCTRQTGRTCQPKSGPASTISPGVQGLSLFHKLLQRTPLIKGRHGPPWTRSVSSPVAHSPTPVP